MAGREVKIHRGRLDKKILADRAQLLQKKISKKIFKNFKKIENIFIFLDGKFEIFDKKSRFFEIFQKKYQNFHQKI